MGAELATAHGTQRVLDAIDRGMKLVVVDPRFSPEASGHTGGYPITARALS